MNIAVVAAGGRLGRVFVEEALAHGHSVRAGVRGKGNLPTHPNLEVVQCDATQAADLMNLVKDQEVVVSALGHVKGSPADVQTTATKLLVDAMRKSNVKRFVDVTGTGVRFSGDKVTLVDILLNLAVRIIDPARVKDGRDHVAVLQASGLDWTTIRVLKLQNVAAKPFELRPHGPTKWYEGRSEVAKAMLQVIEQNSFIKQSPIISKPV